MACLACMTSTKLRLSQSQDGTRTSIPRRTDETLLGRIHHHSAVGIFKYKYLAVDHTPISACSFHSRLHTAQAMLRIFFARL